LFEFRKKNVEPEYKPGNAKIVDQLRLADRWWYEIDPTTKKVVTFNLFGELLTRKKVLKRPSQLYRMMHLNAPGQQFNEDSMIGYFTFFKLFSRACLRGAIENIFDYV
jgi:hypothetical protein